MSIKQIVDQALQDGYLTPHMEDEVGRLCESATELSTEEYLALDRLMEALLKGEVMAMPRKPFINVMEELVMTEALTCLEQTNCQKGDLPDLGDVAAYALNRLPPLYATSEEGAHFQRQRAKNELQDLIHQQVQEGIKRYLERPNVPGQPLESSLGRRDLVVQMNGLLKTLALD